MTATAVARKPDHPGLAPREQIQAQIEARREIAEMARAFRNTMWGKDLPESTAKAVAHWCKRHGVDATEVSVLGGQPYIEASFYLRKLAEADATAIEYAQPDHVHHDGRLLAAMAEPIPEDADDETKALILANRRHARQEHYRRQAERIKHNLPDSAPAAVVYRCKKRGMEREFIGADWCGGKGKKEFRKKDGTKYMREVDPIGDAEPRKTAETRAARRCLRQVIDTFPGLSEQIKRAEDEAKTELTPAIEQDLAAAAAYTPRPIAQVSGAGSMDPYGDVEEGTAEVIEEQPTPAPEDRGEPLATDKQKAFMAKLMQSHVWSEDERAESARFAEQATISEMTERLKFLQEELGERKAAEEAP